ncbi:ABC transporter B family member 4 [Selaginella moellendorffii]|uniref:ABC transporter B family member 4 n=1 Tax=Selaginella moellendorffii TaxID=88036 RepID=UPI000D1CDAC0|nr:ABC transporter B family member 4 [Selaginella moellendorffii]|eukprot:XP_024540365.1 ABC transporter B family member 4 [Selaginella moellendorffii]
MNGPDATARGGQSEHHDDASKQLVPFYKLFTFADRLDYLLMFLGTVGAIGNGLAMPFMTLILGQVTNAFGNNFGDPGKLFDAVSQVAVRFLYLGAGAAVLSFCEVAFWICTGERQATRIRSLYLQATLRQDVSFFDKETNTGEVIERMSGDTVLIQDAIGEKVGRFIRFVTTFVGGFALAFIKGWKLTLVMMSTLPLLVAAGATLAILVSKMAGRGQVAYARAGNIVEQVVSGIRTVASFTGEIKAVEDYNSALKDAYKATIFQGLVSGLGMGFALFTFFNSYALALWYGSRLIINEGYSGGTVLNIIIVVLLGAMSLGQASPCIGAFAAGRAAAYKMFQVINRTPQIDSFDTSGITPGTLKGDIEFQDVDFAYPARPEVQIFKKFCLKVPAGTTAALVGESGSGKSTVISLLERFYDPSGGQILLDGYDVRALQIQWLRRQIGLVSQEPVLFGASIRTNIAYGKDGATNEEILLAAQLSNASKFINKMPEGFDTQVGEQGTQLSGGQKQRIAIARAIIKNPRVLLLDEATSALDAESEHVVQEALDRIMVDRTTVVVAHRLSTVKNASLISVVQDGAIIESGTHVELLKNPDGAYSQLIRLQEVHEESAPAVDPDQVATPNERALSRSGSKNSSGRWSGRWSFGSRKSRTSFSIRRSGGAAPEMEFVELEPRRKRFLFCFRSETSEDVEAGRDAEPKDVSIFRVAALNRPELPILIFGSVAAVAHGIIFPAYSLLLSSMLATFFELDTHKLQTDSNFWALMFVVMAAGSIVVCPSNLFSFSIAGSRLVNRIRQITFSNIIRQEVSWFDTPENSSGAIGARLSSDAASVRGMVGDSLSLAVQNGSTVVAGLVIAFTADWQLALLILGMVPVLSIVGLLQVRLMTGFSADAKTTYQEASRIATSAVSNIRTVASFCAEKKMLELYKQSCKKPLANTVRIGYISGAGLAISTLVQFGSQALIFWYGARLVRQGKTEFKNVFKVFFAIIFTALSVSQTLGLAPDLSKVKASVASIFATIDKKSKIDAADPSGRELEDLKGHIDFRHVSFRYPTRSHVPIFHDLSFSVRAGKTLALVGESGCGKSTVIYLLERFYDPDGGHILVDGVDIRKLQLRWLRQQIGLVSQEPILFTGTIRSNISYGKDGTVTDEEVVNAAVASNAHEFITSLPDGYNTQVGERGIQLSGGQKQRIAIARAIIKQPKILLLDEATSALDAESEHVVQAALDRIMVDRTTIVVAHRLTTIVNADMIAVVKNGSIVEKGKHSDLVHVEGGAYASLVKLHAAA